MSFIKEIILERLRVSERVITNATKGATVKYCVARRD
jgi:hypothetical protein